MSISEAAHRVLSLQKSLRLLPAAELQRLAEDMARIKWPRRFGASQMIYQGRNAEAQTTKGWPDAYCDADNGHIHAIEATREKASWKRHLDEDLSKAAGGKHKKLASYFFVGGYPTHEATDAELTSYRRRFAQLGIKSRDIFILVGHGLAEELARPEYAAVAETILGVAPVPQIFTLLKPGAVHDQQLAGFQPNETDFEQDLVWEPPLVAETRSRLTDGQVMLVRGHGASGKTTFAQSLAKRWAPSPVYYLDLASFFAGAKPSLGTLSQDFVTFGGQNTLFIIDNIHLDETMALQIYSLWHKFLRQKAGLLLLGRELGSADGSSLGPLKPHILRADGSTMQGVVTRLLVRAGYNRRTFAEHAVSAWVQTFGGVSPDGGAAVDLVAFGAAAERRLEQLSRGSTELTATDAVDAVRDRYLAHLNEGERRNLLWLAALAREEVALPESALDDYFSAFSVSTLKLGIVMKSKSGRAGRTLYRLAHSALGELILTAAGKLEEVQSIWSTILEKDPATALQLWGRMKEGRQKVWLQEKIHDNLLEWNWVQRCPDLASMNYILASPACSVAFSPSELASKLVSSSALEQLYAAERDPNVMTQLHLIVRRRAPDLFEAIALYSLRIDALIAGRLCTTSVDEVAGFIDSHPAGREMLSAINTDQWTQAQREITPPQPSDVVGAIRKIESWGRSDLARTPAEALLRIAVSQPWGARTYYGDLGHLSHALRLGSNVGKETLLQALVSVATPEWLDLQYSKLRTGSVASALFSVYNHCAPEFLRYLDRDSLARRVTHELTCHAVSSYKHGIRAFVLFGCSQFVRNSDDFSMISWPSSDTINQLLRHGAMRPPDSDDFGTYEFQYWLGLRRMMAWREDDVYVEPELLAGFKRRLNLSMPPTPAAATARDDMLVWSAACEAFNFHLVRG